MGNEVTLKVHKSQTELDDLMEDMSKRIDTLEKQVNNLTNIFNEVLVKLGLDE